MSDCQTVPGEIERKQSVLVLLEVSVLRFEIGGLSIAVSI
ncbi:unnamed protein product [Amoebophrya sp. A25]|nr:unnamed protein product [Amoebophrya sp. A25]|eukprot:GSA25T00000320001.1